jgi:hypothetical protein
MYCTHCGQQVELGRFCTSCGAPLAALTDEWRTDTSERQGAVAEADAEAEHTAVLPSLMVAPPAPAGLVERSRDLASRRWRTRPPWRRRDGWGWFPWLVLAAVLVAALGWSLGHAWSGSGDGGSAPSVAPDDVVDLTRGATASAPDTAPPHQDLSGDMVPYVAANLLDGVPSTTWRMAGDGTGRILTVQLPSESLVTKVGLINGYAKVDDGTDWYPRNRRVLEVEWQFDDGSTVVQHLDETREMQSIDVGPWRTSTVKLKIMYVSPPGDRNYTAISDLLIEGTPA